MTAITRNDVSCRTNNGTFDYFVVIRVDINHLECVGNLDELQKTEEVCDRVCHLGLRKIELGR